MTRDETKRILMIIDATYANFHVDNIKDTVDAWQFFLADFSYNDIAIALKTFVNTSGKGFAPSVDQLIAMVNKPKELTKLGELEAWAMVRKAIERSGYYSEEEFEKLPPEVQTAIGTPAQLKAWALTDINQIETVVASNFQRSFRVAQTRADELACMPVEARNRIENIKRQAIEVNE